MVWAESIAAGVVAQEASTWTQRGGSVVLSSVAAREFGNGGLVALFAARLHGGIDGGGILPQVVGGPNHLICCFIGTSFELAVHELGQSAQKHTQKKGTWFDSLREKC